jgi:hypothetical protein
MIKIIIYALVGCAILSAIGAFGGPLLCHASDADCAARWQQASSSALTAAVSLGTLLAKIGGDPQP